MNQTNRFCLAKSINISPNCTRPVSIDSELSSLSIDTGLVKFGEIFIDFARKNRLVEDRENHQKCGKYSIPDGKEVRNNIGRSRFCGPGVTWFVDLPPQILSRCLFPWRCFMSDGSLRQGGNNNIGFVHPLPLFSGILPKYQNPPYFVIQKRAFSSNMSGGDFKRF